MVNSLKVASTVLESMNEMMDSIALLNALMKPGMSERHWALIFKEAKVSLIKG